MASLIFRGDAFVLYPRHNQDQGLQQDGQEKSHVQQLDLKQASARGPGLPVSRGSHVDNAPTPPQCQRDVPARL